MTTTTTTDTTSTQRRTQKRSGFDPDATFTFSTSTPSTDRHRTIAAVIRRTDGTVWRASTPDGYSAMQSMVELIATAPFRGRFFFREVRAVEWRVLGFLWTRRGFVDTGRTVAIDMHWRFSLRDEGWDILKPHGLHSTPDDVDKALRGEQTQ